MIGSLVLLLALHQAPPHKLNWEPKIDLPVTGVLVTGWVLSETVFKKNLAVSTCRWCETNGFDNAVRSAFQPSLSPSPSGVSAVSTLSHLTGFVAVPVAMLGLDALLAWQHDSLLETFPVDALLMIETTFGVLAVNQTVKFAVGRGRPYTVNASPELLAQSHDVADNNLSFFSGHSTFTFAAVSSAATVASLRGYRHAWLLWLVGLPLATTTAILRLAADKHWLSDVLVGSALGTAAGILMPTFLHGRVGPVNARVSPQGNGLAISGSF